MRSLRDHFLIAMPAMADPNFTETVTYVCKHDDEGAFGVIVNRPSDLSMAQMFAELKLDLRDRELAEQPVLRGGPVERERGFVLHRSSEAFAATLDGDIKVTVSPDILAAIAQGGGPRPVMVALGYAGWDGGQLEAELRANAWLTVPANPEIVFDTPFEQRWTAALTLPGVDLNHMTNYAGHA
ncbi:MAG TPA: YqgE/AlgH family protein [Gammaproteobacteria bacterium]|nr:YqgE/AlgH family protein [Gammaproteobacteria bacterium]